MYFIRSALSAVTPYSIRQSTVFSAVTLILLVISMVFTACRHNTEADCYLDIAENIMEEHPDSALTLLESIRQNLSDDKAVKARYALLTSMAIDKNGIDTTDFNTLQPAIDYYSTHGTPDEKLRTYYYQGRIFQNREEYTPAMTAFVKALDFKDQATDSLAIARLLIAQAVIYYNEYKASEFIANNLHAAEIYKAKGMKEEESDRYLAALEGYFILEDKAGADSIMNILKQSHFKYKHDDSTDLTNYLISYLIEYGTDKELSALLDSVTNTELSDNDIKLNVARAYLKLNNPGKAMNYIESVINPENNKYRFHKYLILKMEAFEGKGNYKEAYKICREYYSTVDEWHHELFKNDLLFAEQRHALETDKLIKLQNKDRIILGYSFLLLILVSRVIYYFYERTRIKKIITEKEKQTLELERDR